MSFKRKSYILTIFVFNICLLGLFAICGCGQTQPDPSKETTVVIFHVNDMHSQIDNFPKLAWYVKNERQQNPNQDILFLDAGDNFTGNPIADQAKPKGEPVRQLLYKMGIDVMCMGNHEFDLGQTNLARVINDANFKIISANINVHSGPLKPFEPYTILQLKNGLKIAVLGLIEIDKDSRIPASHPDNVKGVTFDDPIETAKKFRKLKSESNIFIALTHIGTEEDEKLAKEMPELDLIVGGHSHTIIKNPMIIDNVMITQAGGQGKFLGRIELVIKDGKVIKKSGQLIPVSAITGEDETMKKMVEGYNNSPALNKVITTFPRAIRGKLELGNLTTDAIRKAFNLDVAFHNTGGLRVDHLKRNVRLKDIFSLHPFGNTVVQFELTPTEIRNLITYDFEKNKRLDIRVGGISYIVTATRDFKVKSIELRTPDGKLLDENKTYKVGMNDYISSSYKFAHKDPGKSLMLPVADVIIRCIEEKINITDNLDQRRTFAFLIPKGKIEKIGETRIDLYAGNTRYPVSNASGNLAADALRAYSNSDICLYPNQLQNPNRIIPANNDIDPRYIRSLYNFPAKNKPMTVEITGKDLNEFISQYILRKGKPVFQVSGIKIALTRGPNGKISSVLCTLPDGKKLPNDKVFKVTFIENEYNKNYKLEKVARNAAAGTQNIIQILTDYIKKNPVIDKTYLEKRVFFSNIQKNGKNPRK